jgi:hypothetical protein
MKTRMFRNSLFAALAVGLALAPTVASASGVSASAGTGTLTGRVALTIPVTVTCTAFWDPNTQQLVDEFINLNVEQASGRAIARANAFTRSDFNSQQLFQCDGSRVTIPLSMLADPTGPPFHGGFVVVSGTVGVDAAQSCGFPGCYFNFVQQQVPIGPQQVQVMIR